MKRSNEVLVGLLTTAAVAILILGTYWLSRGSFRQGYPLYTVVNWGQGLKTGQKVVLAGVAIGHVDDVELRREGTLVIEMRIDRKYDIPYGSQASIQAASIFGDMLVALIPPGPVDSSYAPGDTIPAGKSGASPNDIIANADSVTRMLQSLLSGIQRELIDAGAIAELRSTLAGTNRLVGQLSSIATAQSQELSATMSTLRKAVASVDSATIDSTLQNFQRASANVEEMTEGLTQASGQLARVLTKLESGDGSAAKLLNDPALYDEVRNTVVQLQGILADFKTNPRRYLDFRFSVFGGRR